MDRREEFSNIPTEPPAPNRNGGDNMRGASTPFRTTEAKPFPSTISDEDFIDEDEDYYYASNDEFAPPRDLEPEENWWERQSPVAKAIIVILPAVMIAYFGVLIVLFITSTQQAISATPTSIGRNTTIPNTNTLPSLIVRSPLAAAATPTPQPNSNNIPTVTPRPTPTPAPTPTLLPTPAATTVAPATTTTAAPKPTTVATSAPANATTTAVTPTVAATATLAPATTTTRNAPATTTTAPVSTSVVPTTASTVPATTTVNATSAAPTATKTP